MSKTLLINALIWFLILTVAVAIVSLLLTGSAFHGVILLRVVFALLLADRQPFKKFD